MTGKELQRRLDEVYITANKNAIPNDPESPFITSGMLHGTPLSPPAASVRRRCSALPEFIWQAATDFDNKANDIRRNVRDICSKFSNLLTIFGRLPTVGVGFFVGFVRFA